MMKKIIIFMVMMSAVIIQAKLIVQPGATRTTPVQRVVTTPSPAPVVVPQPVAVPVVQVDKAVLVKKIDEQLNNPVVGAWEQSVDDLFKLATVDLELAREYFKKIREKMAVTDVKSIEVVVEQKLKEKPEVVQPMLPTGEEPMKKSTLPAPSLKKIVREPGETPTVVEQEVPGGEMKKSTMPALKKLGPPPGGPKKAIGGKPAGGPVAAAGKKEEAPKVVEQIFSTSKLQALENDKLLELFNDLLEKLGTVATNWNSTIIEKVVEQTKYGTKSYNAYGMPVPKWMNDIGTLKKVLISKKIMPEEEINKKINDRIAQVRAERTAKPVETKEPVEKPKEELTEEDLAGLINEALKEPKTTEIGWVVAIKGNIKALDKLNHNRALEYQDKFIKLTKEKPFLK